MVRFLELETCNFDGFFKLFVAVHFAVAVGDAGKVKRCGLERVCGGFKTLLVPKRFENVDVCFWSSGLVDLCQDFCDLLEREAVQELAHPDGVCTLRKFGRVVENIAGDSVNTVFKACLCGILFGDCGLPRKVDDGNLYVSIVFAAGDGPFCGVSANIKKSWQLQFC